MDFNSHIQRIQDGVNSVYTLANLSNWIAENTYHEGKNFSYLNHEYQPLVIDDTSKTVIVVKCAQTGLSEIFARWSMAACATQENFTLIWTFPSSTDAEIFCKGRLDPIIASSPEIQRTLSKHVNSVSLKQFGKNSFAYIRGTLSDTGGLSVPADVLVHDEYDKSDMDNISKYISRLQHKPTKMRRVFSTPTVDGVGVSKLAETARRFREVWKCSHCNHTWLPSYENDIHIPGYSLSKREITKFTLKNIRWKEAVLLCPHCGRIPNNGIEHREWVLENPDDNYEDTARFITPFCAPAVLSPSYLVQASTEFAKWSEFSNQTLGLVAEDASEMLTLLDVQKSKVSAPLDSSEVHYMGVDMGLLCHITIGRRTQDGILLVVHRERVSYTKLEERRRELIKAYRVIISVHDVFPYTDIVKRITDYDPNAYGAIYVDLLTTETHKVKEEEEEEEEGKLNVRLVKVNRNQTFDVIMNDFKAGNIKISHGDDWDLVSSHILNMKRIQKFDKLGGIVYKWEKTTGEDHYHHSLAYLWTACNLRGTATHMIDFSTIGLVRMMKSSH